MRVKIIKCYFRVLITLLLYINIYRTISCDMNKFNFNSVNKFNSGE